MRSGTEGITSRSSQISEIGAHEQSIGYQRAESTKGPVSRPPSSSNQLGGFDFQLNSFNKSLASFGTNLSAAIAGSQRSHFENGGDSNMPDHSPRTDTSTETSADEKNEKNDLAQTNSLAPMASDSSDRSKEKVVDQKTLRRLAQNREAARKSRLRKKAYVQQLESSRLKLTQLEQELQRARQQGMLISNSADQSHASGGNGTLAFDAEYSRWLEEHNRQINELRSAVKAHTMDAELHTIVENVTTHYEEVFRLKGNAAKVENAC